MKNNVRTFLFCVTKFLGFQPAKMDLRNPVLGMRVLPAATTPGISSILDALQGQERMAEGNCSLE